MRLASTPSPADEEEAILEEWERARMLQESQHGHPVSAAGIGLDSLGDLEGERRACVHALH